MTYRAGMSASTRAPAGPAAPSPASSRVSSATPASCCAPAPARSVDALAPGLLQGDRRAIARAISRIEQGADDAAALRAALAAHLGRAHVVGITGAPGAGKSTLVHALLGALLARGQRVAVVAVDPSSPLSGGAVLGDRVRMGEHGAHPDVFIRSLAARGHLGGLSPAARAAVDVFDAAGFATVLVETVGTGQSEVEIMSVADTKIVVAPPGLGDAVQALKAGILEIADVLVVSKCDLPGAEATARDLLDMLRLQPRVAAPAWQVPVQRVSAASGAGVAELVELILAHGAALGHGQRLRVDVPGDAGGPDETAAAATARTTRLLEIHTTVGKAEDARRLAEAAVAQRLAACVHMAPVASVYRWQGRVQHDDEVALVFKTTEAAAPQLRALLLAAHPYELPALYTLAVAEASAAYGEWIVQSTRCG